MPHFNLQGDHVNARLRLIDAVSIKFSTLVLCGVESTAKFARMDASGPDRSRLRRRKQTYFLHRLNFPVLYKFRNYVRIMTESLSTLHPNSVRR